MRVNIYAEEMTDRVEIIAKKIDGQTFTGVRLYLYLPTTLGGPHPAADREASGGPVYPPADGSAAQIKGPFIHRPGDDDSAAVTFWGKRDLREVLRLMLAKLDEHYAESKPLPGPIDGID